MRALERRRAVLLRTFLVRTFSVRTAFLRAFPRQFARVFTPTASELGLVGEAWAVHELLARGLSIEGRRLRTAHAEVDIVAREGADLVCVEVKTTRYDPVPRPRGSNPGPIPARFRDHGRLGTAQAIRLRRAARALSGRSGLAPRVDLVEVFLNARSGSVQVEHRRDVAPTRERASRLGGREMRGEA